MGKRVFFIDQGKTEHMCSNCNEHHLSIATEIFNFSKINNKNTEEINKSEDEIEIRLIEDPDNLTGCSIFFCQNCKAEYYYEVDFIVSEETYRSMCPKASEEEVQEYVNNTKDMEVKAFPLYRLDVKEEETVKEI